MATSPPPNLEGGAPQSSKHLPVKRQPSDGKILEAELTAKLEQINSNRDLELSPQKCVLVKSYAQLNDVLFEYRAYFLIKAEKR